MNDREYMMKAREQESPELRAILDLCRQDNAKRFKCVDGVVQFRLHADGVARPVPK